MVGKRFWPTNAATLRSHSFTRMEAKQTIHFLQASYPGCSVYARSELVAYRQNPKVFVNRCDVALFLAPNRQVIGVGETFNEAVSDLMAKCPPETVLTEGRAA